VLVVSQIFLQFDQRPIRLLFQPRSQIFHCFSGDPALAPTLAARGPFRFSRPAPRGRNLPGPAGTHAKALRQLRQAALTLLMRFQQLPTQII
jgi:hypothetical protein